MKTTKNTAARKKVLKKYTNKTAATSPAKSKARIEIKAKAPSKKAIVKRKVARKARPLSAEDFQLQQMAIREERRSVIPQSAERDNHAVVNEGTRPTKKTFQRKDMTKKKPIYPLAHSE